MTFKARPTTYRGIKMRSRLEATYATALDDAAERLGFTWEYEPGAFAGRRGQYLPDFHIVDGPIETFVEVKPTIDQALRILPRMEVILESVPMAFLEVWVGNLGEFTRSPWRGKWQWTPA